MKIDNNYNNWKSEYLKYPIYFAFFLGGLGMSFLPNSFNKKETIPLKEKTSIESKLEEKDLDRELKMITLRYGSDVEDKIKEGLKNKKERTNINNFDSYSHRINKYLPFIRKLSDRYNIPEQDIISLGIMESSFIPNITSHADARGIMQLLPSTAEEVCGLSEEELNDPYKNMNCGVKYFNNLINYFEGINAEHRSKELALMSYNWGIGNVRRELSSYIKDNKIVDPDVAYHSLMYSKKIPKVTKEYVEKFNRLTNQKKVDISLSPIAEKTPSFK